MIMRYLFTIIFIILLSSCTQKRTVQQARRFMKQQIELSLDMKAVWKNRDTILTAFLDTPIKLVVWYDSLSCLSCEVSKLHAWNNIVVDADSLAPWFRIIYLFTPQKEYLHRLQIVLKTNTFDYPLFIDQNTSFVKQNPMLPPNQQLHSFLLDKNNRVVLVGSPLHNPTLWALYKRTIKKMIENDGLLPKGNPML